MKAKSRWVDVQRVDIEVHQDYVQVERWRQLLVARPPLHMFSDDQIVLQQLSQPLMCVAQDERRLFYLSDPKYLQEIQMREINSLFVTIVDEVTASEMIMASNMGCLSNGYDQINSALVLRLPSPWSTPVKSPLTSKWPQTVRALAAVSGVSESSLQRRERESEKRYEQLFQCSFEKNSSGIS